MSEIVKALRTLEHGMVELGAERPIIRIVVTHRAMHRLIRSLRETGKAKNFDDGQVGDGNVWCEINGIRFETEF